MSICMKIPRLPKCCCCVELRTGALILSILNVIGSVIFFLTFGGALVAVSVVDDDQIPPESREDFVKYKPLIIALLVILTGAVVVGAIFNVVLLIGLVKRRRSWVEVCLWVTAIIMILTALSALGQLFVDPGQGISNLIGLVIQVYFWMCIQSYYQEMVDERQRQQQQPLQYKN